MADAGWHLVQVGCGGFGRYHLQVWRKHPAVAQVTVLGRDLARLAPLEAELGCAVTTDPAVLATADLVDLVTPPDTHYALASAALAQGRPTIVEKPPCRTAAEARRLAELAGAIPLYCVQNLCWSPVWQRVKELLASGVIGQPRLSLWPVLTDQRRLLTGGDFRSEAARGGGALLDGAIHYAYLVPWVLGAPIRAVTAWAGQLAASPPAGEDTGLAVWQVGEGVAQLTYSWAVADPPRSAAATLIGDKGTLLVPRSAKQPLELLQGRQVHQLDLGPWQTTSRNDLGNCLGHYLDCARQQAAPQTSWAAAVQAQEVIEATLAAAASGHRQVVP
ncbi:MAG: Gfo/Idh/MocA family oxidoreductase [Fimbriimonadaceae bacterium]|nr:Gfo/Idh/MocA family oxidoreductase [Fimbriimonadaceae bacterium]